MTISEKLQTIAENEDKLYGAGATKEWSDFWDVFQNYGKSVQYMRAFAFGKFTMENYKPKYPIKASELFEAFNGFTTLTDTLVDIEIADQLTSPARTFGGCKNLKTIRKIKITSEKVSFPYDFFTNCTALENVTFEGTIRGYIQLTWSKNITHDSLMNIINNLADYSEDTSGTTGTFHIGSTNIAKLTAEELQIVTEKGWVYK